MRSVINRRHALALIGTAVIASPAALPALAKGQGGASARDGNRSGDAMAQQLGDRDQLRDRDRLRDMDRLAERIHQSEDAAERERLMTRYRQHLDAMMGDLNGMAGPGPEAGAAERLRHLERRDERMQELLRHMWRYQSELEGSSG